jgi:hypothetical protein
LSKYLFVRSCRVVVATFLCATTLSLLARNVTFESPAIGRFILGSSHGRELLQQCSRPTPTAVSGVWQPSTSDVDELELALRKHLEKLAKAGQDTPPKGQAYHRQYVGFTRKSERFIYGNFYPASAVTGVWKGKESKQAFRICDGGPAFWGIVFRVSTKAFEELQFNGLG